MEESTVSLGQLATTSKTFARRLLTIGENRLELLTVEVQEERERLLHAFLLALGVATFGLLAGLTLTAAIAVLLWACSPLAVLLILTGLYAAAGICLYRQLNGLMRNWQTLSASLNNSERTAHVWKKSSHEAARIAETIAGRGKRTQSRATGSGLADDGGRSPLAREPGKNHQFHCFGGCNAGCRSVILASQKNRARRRKTFVVADPSEGRGSGRLLLVGIPFTTARSRTPINSRLRCGLALPSLKVGFAAGFVPRRRPRSRNRTSRAGTMQLKARSTDGRRRMTARRTGGAPVSILQTALQKGALVRWLQNASRRSFFEV